jgi:hypothetical protein
MDMSFAPGCPLQRATRSSANVDIETRRAAHARAAFMRHITLRK